ncbi:MAG: hypothetical protein QNJ77_03005 [Acidimicrobiia bacterium]|nr:hypothetical protein [Acidimicrobiia bacterium]
MKTSARILTALTITVILSPGATGPDGESTIARTQHAVAAKVPEQQPGSIIDASPRQHAAAEAALRMFEDAGLGLPPVDIVFHESTIRCDNRNGYYHLEHGRHVVDVCMAEDYPEVFLEQLIVHELAHAWDVHVLTDAIRSEFMELRKVDIWHSREVHWKHRGTEHAAEIITWGVFDKAMPVITLDNVECDELQEGYETLTGMVANRSGADLCASWSPEHASEPAGIAAA